MTDAFQGEGGFVPKIIGTKDRAATGLSEYLLGIKMLKSYNQTGRDLRKLGKDYRDLMEAGKAESVCGFFAALLLADSAGGCL